MLVGMPTSVFLMSVSQFVIVGNWLWEGKVPRKLRSFSNNRPALFVSGIFVIHVIGMLYTTDFTYGLNDLRVKLPILLLPLFLSTLPAFERKHIVTLISLFVLTVFITSVIGVVRYEWLDEGILNKRIISPFISHIRFSLMVCISLVFIFYHLYKNGIKQTSSFVGMAISLWFVWFLLYAEFYTGVVVAFVCVWVSLVFWILHFSFKYKWAYFSVLIILPIILSIQFYRLYTIFKTPLPNQELLLGIKTPSGEEYHSVLEDESLENGYYVWRNIAAKELEREWNRKSGLPYHGTDRLQQPLYSTIARYMSSKGLRKDSIDFQKLSKKDVLAIENGFTNVNQLNGTTSRLESVFFEFDNIFLNKGNTEGNSIAQRLEFWKNGWSIIKKAPLFGVGTGDIKIAFQEAYNENETQLSEKYRLRTHNQFLTIFICLGVFGFVGFVFAVYYPLFFSESRNYVFSMFLLIVTLSFLNEDTLETQAGVSFFAFFYSFILFLFPSEKSV